jgi:hypothetical protein
VLDLSTLSLVLRLSFSVSLLFAVGCQDVGITEAPEREGDDPGECADNADNDADGTFDCDDPDCSLAPECRENTPPNAPEIRIDPWVPTTTDNLVCVIDVPSADAEGDEITYTYRWEVDAGDGGDEPTISSDATAKHEVWTCFVTPSDGIDTGSTVTASVTVDNTPPSAPGVSIEPGSPTTDDSLECTVTTESVDADGDNVTYTFGWERDGIEEGRSGSSIPPMDTANNDQWKCIVTPHDDEEEGATGSDTVEVHFDIVAHVAAGRWHTCGIGFDGAYSCWGVTAGGNHSGQVTNGPAEAFGVVSVGEKHSCGMTLDGTVRCWGEDGNNQGSDPFGTYTRLSSGYNHACGILTTEEVSCWGTANNWVAAPPAGPWESVTSGDEFACALRANGTVSCWNGVTAPGGDFTQIDAGGGHACGVQTNGTLLCWGDNSHGQVSPVPPGSTWYSVSAGDTHTCAIDGDDWSVTCWGNSANGQLVAPGGTYDQVDAGWNHTCAVRNNGQVACWGCAGADEGQCSP